MESPESMNHTESQKENIIDLSDFCEKLEALVDEDVVIENVEGTYEIEIDSLTLTFAIDDDVFEIRLIDTHGLSNLGSKILDVIHSYSDENGLNVIASNVVDEARGFWEKNGYQESEDNEFYRVG